MSEDIEARRTTADTEAALLAAYRDGDVNALGELVRMYRKPLYAFIFRMLGSPTEADDIFQEVWFRAIRGMNAYKHKSFVSWLFRIAHNLVVDRARQSQARRLAAPCAHAQTDPPGDWAETFPDPQPGPDRIAMGRELAARIQAALADLPAEQREVFLLRMEAGVPFREIARIQGTSINTALSRMQYALDKVRQTLRDEKEIPS